MKIESDFGKKAFNLQKEPTGFSSPGDVIINGDSSTRTVTLTGTTDAYWRGCKIPQIISGWTSPAHGTDTTTPYFLVYKETGAEWIPKSSVVENELFQNVYIALAFYNSQDSVWVYGRECHGLMPWQVHRAEHRTIGTYKQSGGGIDDYTLNSTTAADRRPSVEASLIYDEDLPTTNPLLAANGPYTQFYLSNSGETNVNTSALDIVPLSGNQPYYNEFDGTNWVQTLVATGDYMSIWLVALPMASDTESQKLRYLWVQGQTESDNLSDERSLTPNDVSLGNFQDLEPEVVFIQRVIIRYIGGNWQFIEVESIDGTRFSQTSSPQGNYLSSVSTDTTLTGLGTTSSPLGLSGDINNLNLTNVGDITTTGTVNNDEFKRYSILMGL